MRFGLGLVGVFAGKPVLLGGGWRGARFDVLAFKACGNHSDAKVFAQVLVGAVSPNDFGGLACGLLDVVGDLHDLVHQNFLGSEGDVQEHVVRTSDVAVVQQRALERFGHGLGCAALARCASRAHDGTSAVPHDGVDVVHVDVDLPGQGDDFSDAFGGGAQDLIGVGKRAADGLVAKQLPKLVVADDQKRVHGGPHLFEAFCGLLVASASLKHERHGHNAHSQDATLLARLGDDWGRARSCAASHARGQEHHAGVGPQQVQHFVQAFNRGVLAHFRKGPCALPTCECGPKLHFAWNGADVQCLGIRVADDEVDAVDAFLVHGVDRVGAATTHADHFDGRVGRLWKVEVHGMGFSGVGEVKGLRRRRRFRTSS